MAPTLAEVLRHFGPAVLRSLREQGRDLHPSQARAWRAIVACGTAALGGQRLRCDDCGAEQLRFNACRNRHCPQCGSRQREAWRRRRGAELLDVPYAHLVFTLPHELNALAAARPAPLYDLLIDATAATLTQFAADARWLGGIGAFSLVLHTWAQDLSRHLHVHALMACGALARDDDGAPRWQPPRRSPTFLFPVQALSAVFKAKFIEALQAWLQAQAGGARRLPPLDLQDLRGKPWVVYAKTPLAGPAAVLDYLSRYTHRTAIGNERLRGIEHGQVLFSTRVNGKGGRRNGRKITTIPGEEFVRRFLQHVLPRGFKRIRHYGLLAPAAKAQRLASARALLAMPPANAVAAEAVDEFMRRVAGIEINQCSHCRSGRWRLVECIEPQRCAPTAAAHDQSAAWSMRSRGPP